MADAFLRRGLKYFAELAESLVANSLIIYGLRHEEVAFS